MPKIHLPASVYTAPGTISGWQWLPYTDKKSLATLKAAIRLIDTRIKGYKPCNAAFKALAGGKTFAQVWSDNSVWISYDPGKKSGRYGVTYLKKHISITHYSLAMGKWTAAATLVHELAHVNGAPGTNTKAEDTLLKCLLKTLHDPNIIGSINNSNRLRGSLFA